MKIFPLLFLLLSQIACFSRLNIQQATLNTALLDDYYEYDFEVDAAWSDPWDNSTSVQLIQGNLPRGMGISSDGLLFGTPQIVGDFEFRVGIYDIGTGSENNSWSDTEWFTLFVTEPSTNEECPSPDDEDVNEFYVCAGTLSESNVVVGDEIELDVNIFINRDDAGDFDFESFSFQINYDSRFLALDEDDLNSGLLREAATRNNASVTFDNTTEGVLLVELEADKGHFVRGGRLMNLPFHVIVDMPEDTYEFSVTINELIGSKNATLPETVAIGGTLILGSAAAD